MTPFLAKNLLGWLSEPLPMRQDRQHLTAQLQRRLCSGTEGSQKNGTISLHNIKPVLHLKWLSATDTGEFRA